MRDLVLASLAVLALPGAARSQTSGAPDPVGDPAGRVGCFRGRPLPDCRSFWIFEIQVTTPVASRDRVFLGADGSTYRGETLDRELEWNVGHMVNVSSRLALGGVLTAGTGSPDGLAGVKVRGRYRLDPEVSLELEGGWLRSQANGTRPDGVDGVTADLRLNLADRISAFATWDRLFYDPDPYAVGTRDDGFSVGLGLGSWPAVVGTGVVGLAFAVLLGLYVSQAS